MADGFGDKGRFLALVVDDNEIGRMAAAAVLSGCGVDAVLAESGAQAVAFAQSKRFDLVLMDHRMPVMDGVETVRRIRALGGWCSRVPVVGLSAESGGEVLQGMDARLAKPLDADALRGVLAGRLPRLYPEEGAGAVPGRPPQATEWESVHALCPHLDVRAAKGRFGGSFTAYRNVLQVFCSGVAETAASMQALAQAGDRDGLRIAVHAQRGALQSVGAAALAKRALELETLVDGRKTAEIPGAVQLFAQQLLELNGQLAPLWHREDAPAVDRPAATAVQRELVPERVRQILALLTYLEREEALRVARALAAPQYGGKADRLLADALQKIDHFNYDGATALLQEFSEAVVEV